MRQCGLDHQVGGQGVDRQEFRKPGRGRIVNVSGRDQGGVVDDRIEFAEPRDGEFDQPVGTTVERKVFDVECCVFFAKLPNQFFAEVLLQAVDDDRGSFRDTTLRDRFADSRAASGDDDRFVFES